MERIPKLELSKIRTPLPKQRAKVHINEDLKVYDRNRMKQDFKKDITDRLDRVASEIETDHPKLALAVDLVSDHLEQRKACENPMLIENSLRKIDSDLKNMKDWFQNIEVESLRGRLESIHKSLSKHIEEVKEQFKR